MYIFISIILIAELIIATAIICQIVKLDKWAIATNSYISEFRPKMEQGLNVFKLGVTKLVDYVQKISLFIKTQREKIILSILQNILITILIISLRGKRKKYLSGIQLVLALKDFWNS